MSPAPIYLDNNATTRPADEVVAAMTETLRSGWANPSSAHRMGQASRRRLELARDAVAALLGSSEREIVFTSGGTEAADLAIRGCLERPGAGERTMVIASRVEHSAVRGLLETLATRGVTVRWLGCDEAGVVRVDELEAMLAEDADRVAVVSVMWANNETGVVQPIARLGAVCRTHGVPFHTDATQWIGRMPVDLSRVPVDLASFAAHKLHGPQGVGGLYVRRGVRLGAQLRGGPQERERRGGTENVPGIIGFGVAADLARVWLGGDGPAAAAARRDRLESGLLALFDDAVVNGAAAERIWTTSNIAFPNLEAEAILLMLSERGLCASAGSACSSGSLEPSPVLEAMGVPPALAMGSIRFSLARDTPGGDVDRAVQIVAEVIGRLRQAA